MSENKRYFFRVPIINIDSKINGKTSGQEIVGRIKDLSALGISIYNNKRVEVFKFEKVEIEFEIEGKKFKREAKFVREFEYGIDMVIAYKFINNNEKENSELSSLLLKLDSKRKR